MALFKLSYEDDIYLIRIQNPAGGYLAALHAAAGERWAQLARRNISHAFSLSYLDKEGDRINVSTENDLLLAMEISTGATLKLTLTKRNNKAKSKESTPSVTHSAFCDHCRSTIVGVRYKCGNCPDYDLCSTCESKGEHGHAVNHVFLKCNKQIGRYMTPLLSHPLSPGPFQQPPRPVQLPRIVPQVGEAIAFDGRHKCQLTRQIPYAGSYICDGCGMGGSGMSYHCAEHKFDLHPQCLGRRGPIRGPLRMARPNGPNASAPAESTNLPAGHKPLTPLKSFKPVEKTVEEKAPEPTVIPVVPVAPAPAVPAPAPSVVPDYVGPVITDAPSIIAVPSAPPADAPAEAPAEVPAEPAYANELNVLIAMGFDPHVAAIVLSMRKGDLALALQDLLGQ